MTNMTQVYHKDSTFPIEPDLGNQVPRFKKLQERLGLPPVWGDVLKRELVKFRKTYTTTDGQPGDSLLFRKVTTDQKELAIMAETFLDRGAGYIFWSKNREWFCEGSLIYPHDKAK